MSERPNLYIVIHEYQDDRLEELIEDEKIVAHLDYSMELAGFGHIKAHTTIDNYGKFTKVILGLPELPNAKMESIVTRSVGALTLWLCERKICDTELSSVYLKEFNATSQETQNLGSMIIEARRTEAFTQQAFSALNEIPILGS